MRRVGCSQPAPLEDERNWPPVIDEGIRVPRLWQRAASSVGRHLAIRIRSVKFGDPVAAACKRFLVALSLDQIGRSLGRPPGARGPLSPRRTDEFPPI